MATGLSVSDEFNDITKALDVIEDRIAFMVDRDQLGNALCETVELSHRVQALVGKLGWQASSNGVAMNHGQRTIGQYVASRTNSRAIDIDRLITTAKWLRNFPIFEAAYGHELTDAHVHYLRTKLDATYDTHCRLVDDQEFCVSHGAAPILW